jgi:hypothetical protein
MSLAALASLRSPDSNPSSDRKRAEGKRHDAPVIGLPRRRCDVVLTVLRTGWSYQAKRVHSELAEGLKPPWRPAQWHEEHQRYPQITVPTWSWSRPESWNLSEPRWLSSLHEW